MKIRMFSKWATGLAFFLHFNGHALDIDGNETREGERAGLVGLYLFDETSGDIIDSSGSGLNLQVPATGIDRSQGHLKILQALPPGSIVSATPATQMIRACRESGEMTVEAYIQNTQSDQRGPARIVTLSSGNQARNFTLGTDYNGQDYYVFRIRTEENGNNGTRTQIKTPGGSLIVGTESPQHLVVTRNREGLVRFFVDGALVREEIDGNLRGDLMNWDENFQLSLGNEMVDDRPWVGEIHMLALYCRAKSFEEVAGDLPFFEFPAITPSPGEPITENRSNAYLLFQSLTGLKAPIDSPEVIEMESQLESQNVLEAARIATSQPAFYNLVVKDFAAEMSTREESTRVGLNDFVATVIGNIRDERSAKELLTSKSFYRADRSTAAVPMDEVRDFLSSNDHYQQLEVQNYDLSRALIRYENQLVISSDGQSVRNPHAAGVLTSRTFMQAHADAGTNRRLVEYAFREFLCTPIENWADATAPDSHIGRDVDRYPGGQNGKFQTTCKSCHSVMDGFRGAFAAYDFDDELVKNSLFLTNGFGELEMRQQPAMVAVKMNQNSEVFPLGFQTSDSSWVNNAVSPSNRARFGWRDATGAEIVGPIKGTGVGQFGELLANSRAFSNCMVKRVSKAVCGHEPDSETYRKRMADHFEASGHKLKSLFEQVAIQPECLGFQGGKR